MLNQIKNLLCEKAEVFLWIYLWGILSLNLISNDAKVTFPFFILLGAISGFIVFLLLKLLQRMLCDMHIDEEQKTSEALAWGGGVFLITFTFFMIYFAGQYPGGFLPDNNTQYAQAVGDKPYNDWHPVLHTLIFYTLPLKLGGKFENIIFLQLLYFSMAFGYLIYVLRKNGCSVLFLIINSAYVCLNPFLATHMVFPQKDVAFTIFTTLLIGYYIQIICTKGEWLYKKYNLIMFSAITIIAMYMRHNAILFVFPLLLIVLFYGLSEHRKRITVVILCTVFFLFVKFVYAYLDVEKPTRRTQEVIGLPLTIWCQVMQDAPEALPEGTREAMYEMASKAAYESYAGEFNSIKWSGEVNLQRVDQTTFKEVFKYTWQCFRYAPESSIKAVAKLTSLVWSMDGDDEPITLFVRENSWGIESEPRLRAKIFLEQIKSFFTSGIGSILFGSIGMISLAMVSTSLFLLHKHCASMVHAIPMICYNFGTMLLLNGRDYRFFLYNLPIWLAVMFLMFKDGKN